MGELGIARKRQLSVMEMGDECGVNWEMAGNGHYSWIMN